MPFHIKFKDKPASMSALFTVPTPISAASVSVSAPPLPLPAAAARGGTAVVAVLFVPFRCKNCDKLQCKTMNVNVTQSQPPSAILAIVVETAGFTKMWQM